MKIIAVIPARMGSTRFPGKPLAKICGLPMIEHVYKRVKMSKLLSDVFIATCDQEIVNCIETSGGKAVITSDAHERCTDRVAEAVLKIAPDADIVVNVQGDEPLVYPEMINVAIQPLLDESKLQAVHLVSKIKTDYEFNDPNEVKVVFDRKWNTLYCSREPIPSSKKGGKNYDRWKQVCIIPFRKDFLFKFNALPQTFLEKLESVDMMRAVEHGYKVRCVESTFNTISVDTPADLKNVEKLMLNDSLYPY